MKHKVPIHSSKSYLWYIDSCLTSIDKYFMDIQEDKKCNNIKNKWTAIREEQLPLIATGTVAGRVEYGRNNRALLATMMCLLDVEMYTCGVQRARNDAGSKHDTHCNPWADISHCYRQIPYRKRYPLQNLWFLLLPRLFKFPIF